MFLSRCVHSRRCAGFVSLAFLEASGGHRCAFSTLWLSSDPLSSLSVFSLSLSTYHDVIIMAELPSTVAPIARRRARHRMKQTNTSYITRRCNFECNRKPAYGRNMWLRPGQAGAHLPCCRKHRIGRGKGACGRPRAIGCTGNVHRGRRC